jgi:hypothetical protein
MNKVPCKFLETTLPPKKAFAIDVPPDYPKLHTLSVINGKRGGGKTVCVVNYLKKLLDEGLMDKVWVVTPTYYSNKDIWKICYLDEEDCRQPSITVLTEIVTEMEEIKEEWDEYERQMELYKDFEAYMADPTHEVDELKLLKFFENGYVDIPYVKKPVWKYERKGEAVHPPRFAVVLDDCLSSPVMRKPTAGLVNFAIRHRHVCDGLGCSLFMLVQTYCARGGIDRAIRENTTHLYLFRIADMNQIKRIHEECDLPIQFEEFVGMLQEVHSVPFNFLLIDFNPETPEQQYRNGWNEYLIPPSVAAGKPLNLLDEIEK